LAPDTPDILGHRGVGVAELGGDEPVGSTEFEYDVAQHSKITARPE
jgi:hypothetical protein